MIISTAIELLQPRFAPHMRSPGGPLVGRRGRLETGGTDEDVLHAINKFMTDSRCLVNQAHMKLR